MSSSDSSPALNFTSPARQLTSSATTSTMSSSLIRNPSNASGPISELLNGSGAGSGSAVGSGSKSAIRKGGLLTTPVMKAALPFINGGLAGMVATTVIQPIDMIKVRIQLAPSTQSSLQTTAALFRSSSLSSFYTGLSAGLLRQAVYTTARLGVFETMMKKVAERGPVGFKERAGAGLAAGGIAAFLGNPADLALIRMQSDGLLPPHLRANHTSVFTALSSIIRTEGILSLWTGATPTIARAMALNFGQLAFFSEAKSQLNTLQKDGYHNLETKTQTLVASGIAGFFASVCSLPFDFVKTRMQNQAKSSITVGGIETVAPRMGMVKMSGKILKEEGLGRFYKGFPTYFVRIAPHAMVTLLVADALNLVTR